jgi:hypothetical protein
VASSSYRDGVSLEILLVRHGLGFCVRFKPKNIARLARERPADGIKRRKADRARLAGLEDREVGQRHFDPIREIRQRHPSIVKQVVELDGDGHVTRSL